MKIIVAIVLLFALPGSAFAQAPPPVPTIIVAMSGSGSASASRLELANYPPQGIEVIDREQAGQS